MPSDFAELPVRLGREIECGLLAPGLDGDVVGFGFAGGHFVAGEVGNAGERLAQPLVESGGGRVQLVELVFEGAGLVHHGALRVLAGLLQRAHLLAQLVAAGLELLGLVMASRRLWSRARKSPRSEPGRLRARAVFLPLFPGCPGQNSSRACLYQFNRRSAASRF